MGIDVRQYTTTVEEFLALGNLYPAVNIKWLQVTNQEEQLGFKSTFLLII